MVAFLTSFNIEFWLLQTAAMLLTCVLLPKLKVDGVLPAFLTVLALAFINSHLWDAALFLNIPDSLSLKALALVVTNGFFFWIIVKILPGISISGVLDAILAPMIFSLLTLLIEKYHTQIPWQEIWDTVVATFKSLKGYMENSAKA